MYRTKFTLGVKGAIPDYDEYCLSAIFFKKKDNFWSRLAGLRLTASIASLGNIKKIPEYLINPKG